MGTKFPYAELVKVTRQLPQPVSEYQLPDYEQTQLPESAGASSMARLYQRAYRPLMETHLDLSDVPKVFHETVRLQNVSGRRLSP